MIFLIVGEILIKLCSTCSGLWRICAHAIRGLWVFHLYMNRAIKVNILKSIWGHITVLNLVRMALPTFGRVRDPFRLDDLLVNDLRILSGKLHGRI